MLNVFSKKRGVMIVGDMVGTHAKACSDDRAALHRVSEGQYKEMRVESPASHVVIYVGTMHALLRLCTSHE